MNTIAATPITQKQIDSDIKLARLCTKLHVLSLKKRGKPFLKLLDGLASVMISSLNEPSFRAEKYPDGEAIIRAIFGKEFSYYSKGTKRKAARKAGAA